MRHIMGDGKFQAENDLREIKNFADPTYSKSKLLTCIDWLPRRNDIVAVSAVRNMSFDERIGQSGLVCQSTTVPGPFPFVILFSSFSCIRPHGTFYVPHRRTDLHLLHFVMALRPACAAMLAGAEPE